MRVSRRAGALAVALAGSLAGCASSAWEKTESVPGGKLYVPRIYAPLRPGSIYPDKKVLVPAKGRPAIVLVCPPRGDCRKKEILDQAAQRGMIVLLLSRSASLPQTDDLLRTRAEVSAERIGWLLVAPTADSLRRWMERDAAGDAIAVVAPPRVPMAALPSFPSRKILVADLHLGEPPEANDGAVLKLYAPDSQGRLPREAFRDAVEWLAGELAAR